jgi:hypothetical protein
MDPLVLKYLAGGGVLLLGAVMTWCDKLDKGVMTTLIVGAAAAIGFQIAPS